MYQGSDVKKSLVISSRRERTIRAIEYGLRGKVRWGECEVHAETATVMAGHSTLAKQFIFPSAVKDQLTVYTGQ